MSETYKIWLQDLYSIRNQPLAIIERLSWVTKHPELGDTEKEKLFRAEKSAYKQMEEELGITAKSLFIYEGEAIW